MRCVIVILCLLLPLPSLAATPPLLGIIHSDTVHTLFGEYPIIPAGDQNGDSLADFWTWDLRWQEYLFHGSRGAVSSAPTLRLNSIEEYSLPLGANVGDLSGDGYADFAFTWRHEGVDRVNVYYGGPGMDTVPDLHFGVNTGELNNTLQPFAHAVRADFDADGQEEIVTWSRDGYYALLYRLGPGADSVQDLVLRPQGFAYQNFGWSPAAGDFDGDGQPDLVLSLNFDTRCPCKGEIWLYRGGPTFDTIPEVRFTAPLTYQPGYGMEYFGSLLLNLGDVNGDGYDDLYAGYDNSYNLPSYIYFGGLAFDTIPDVTISDVNLTAAAAGDINRDGYADLITGLPLVSSSGAYVYVYYGGPVMDSIADIRIYAGDLPDYNLRLGASVAGLGDFNGDGVDDFAAGARDAFGRGEIFIFSGTGEPVDVPDGGLHAQPNNFTLQQNYPNPFNPTTTVSFDLPKRTTAKLSIFNIRGERVTTLLDRELAAGTYRLTWDGRDAAGRAVASGVYLYRLETAEAVQTKKMLLLK